MINLDQIEQLHQLDNKNMVNHTCKLAEQFENSFKLMNRFSLNPDFPIPNKIIISGTGGGSGFIGNFIRDLFHFDYSFPIFINQGYRLPLWSDSNTLVFCLSYSGNTEEILSCFEMARENGVNLIGITKGGQLQKKFIEYGYPYVLIPHSDMQARSAIGSLFVPIVWILERLGLIGSRPRHEILEAIPFIKNQSESYSPEIPVKDNQAKVIAQSIYQKIPFIYTMDLYHSSIALRWKNQFSENSKILAHANTIPAMHHDEIVGWESRASYMKYVKPILFRDTQIETDVLAKRLNLTKLLLEESYEQPVLEIKPNGNSLIERLFSLIILGDWVSIYLAFLNLIDPTPVSSIQKLKAMLVSS